MMIRCTWRDGVLIAALLLMGCSQGPAEPAGVENNGAPNSTAATDHQAAEPMSRPAAAFDVPAELGGAGFTGEGWITAHPDAIGDPRAVKGGVIRTHLVSWPDNLRVYGIKSNTWLNSVLNGLCYESLLSMDPRTMEVIPRLASHWQIADDQMTFRFRINPSARWSDGKPVSADDVIATYRLVADDSLLDPMTKASIVEKMHEPEAESKYMVVVRCKTKDWRNFISISSMTILPAHQLNGLTGKQYLDQYNFRYMVGTGPYILHAADIKTDQSVTATRRKDYWDASAPENQGLYNFDKLHFLIIREDRLAFDKAIKGELDFYNVNTAKWWVEDLSDAPAVANGYLVRRKVFTRYPRGFQGNAMNLGHPPLDDVRVRKALAHLYDRKTMLEKFAYNEYVPLKSYFPGGDGENLENPLADYDPRAAVDLLKQAGWTERGSDGILTKGGQRLSFTVNYASQFLERYLTVYQEACKNAGVDLKLKLQDDSAAWDKMQARAFEMSGIAWGGSLFPDPKSNWHSSMAEAKGSNNFVQFRSAEADRLIEAYDKEFDNKERNELLRQLDAELFAQHPYVLDWSLPCERFVYWNKFGMPDTVLLKYQRFDAVYSLWWYDPAKDKALKEARRAGAKLESAPLMVEPWSDSAPVAASPPAASDDTPQAAN